MNICGHFAGQVNLFSIYSNFKMFVLKIKTKIIFKKFIYMPKQANNLAN